MFKNFNEFRPILSKLKIFEMFDFFIFCSFYFAKLLTFNLKTQYFDTSITAYFSYIIFKNVDNRFALLILDIHNVLLLS